MKIISGTLALLVLATPALAQAVNQGEMCAKAPVMPTPGGNAENRMLSDEAEVTDKVGLSKQIIKPEQAMAAGQVVLRAGTLHHAAVEYRRTPTPASLHTRMAEFFYVVDGEATRVPAVQPFDFSLNN